MGPINSLTCDYGHSYNLDTTYCIKKLVKAENTKAKHTNTGDKIVVVKLLRVDFLSHFGCPKMSLGDRIIQHIHGVIKELTSINKIENRLSIDKLSSTSRDKYERLMENCVPIL